MRTALALTLTFTTLTACQDSDPFDEAAYFRGDNRNRVFVLTAAPGTSTRDVLTEAEAQSHTAGRFTAVFVFEADSAPGVANAVTLASNYQSAIDLVYSPGLAGWRWRFMRSPDGGTDWTDCQNPRGHEELCNLR